MSLSTLGDFPKILIGIDPDLKKSGFAVWYKDEKDLNIGTLSFFDLQEALRNWSRDWIHGSVEVIIEAGWLNSKSNFHSSKKQSKVVGERIAKNVGENHATGKLIAEMCEHLKLNYKLVKPTTKKTDKDLFKKITGIDCKNQEMIDAAMMVYGL